MTNYEILLNGAGMYTWKSNDGKTHVGLRWHHEARQLNLTPLNNNIDATS